MGEALAIQDEQTSQISSPEYWSRRAEDYNDYIRTSNFDHGYKIKELLMSEGVLAADMDVLDIAAGPGSITIPFAGVARKVTAVEPAVEMCRHLRINADEKG
jgi:ubiquinone/menaquinone biosynthesis C-methylase UbiE